MHSTFFLQNKQVCVAPSCHLDLTNPEGSRYVLRMLILLIAWSQASVCSPSLVSQFYPLPCLFTPYHVFTCPSQLCALCSLLHTSHPCPVSLFWLFYFLFINF